jgi:carboxypeptidase family protein
VTFVWDDASGHQAGRSSSIFNTKEILMFRCMPVAPSWLLSAVEKDGQSFTIANAQAKSVWQRVGYAVIWTCFVLLAVVPAANSQSVTGQISGTVIDTTGGVIVSAKVQLTHDLSKQVRIFMTDASGAFVFTNLVPGDYSVRVMADGFRIYDLSGIKVSAQERVDLHNIKLEAGNVSEEVTVQAGVAHVATYSSDRGIGINLRQIEDTPIRGRDYKAIIKTLPGVIDLGNHDTRGWGSGTPTINGGQQGQVLVTLDGIGSQDSGAPSMDAYLSPSVDAIGELKLLVSNYAAEYGARNGGQLNVTIKNGTNEFHGSGYFFWRHESLNANEWFNNRTGVVKPIYRFQNPGGTIGGPVIIPGTRFNKDRKKLFFFFSYDYLRNKGATGVNRYTMPTTLERAGNFSQTVNGNGQLILIKDPTNPNPCTTDNRAGCFPGNIIPSDRISPIGSAILNLFPLPNTTDPTGQRQYNAQYQLTNSNPRQDKILRIDYNVSPKTTVFARMIQDYQGQDGFGAILGAAGDGWGQFPHGYDIASAGAVGTVIHAFRSDLINEFTWGINRAHQMNVPLELADQRSYQASQLPLKGANGETLDLPNVFGANSLKLLPNINFGFPAGFGPQTGGQGVPNLPTFGFDSRWPFDGTDQVMNLTDSLTWIKGNHNFKFGFYYERMARNVSVYSTFNTAGTYYFGVDLAGNFDTGNPFSNALVGSIFAYGEDNKKQTNHARYTQIEWFAQDTWKIKRRLTLDYGMRFQLLNPDYSKGATLGIFTESAYDGSKAGQLLFPALVNGEKKSINPVTGKVYEFTRQGTFDPESYPADGNPFSGIVQYDSRFFHNPGLQLGPRVGLAWDVFGNGKTALRMGFGTYYGRAFGVDTIGATGAGTGPMTAPPDYQAPIYLNTTIANLSSERAVLTPFNVNGGSQDYRPPVTYSWSFGIQQDLGRGLILDVAYVGNAARNQFSSTNHDINAVPPYTTWTPDGGANPAYLDPTGSGGFYSTNLIRAMTGYQGYGSINVFTQLGKSSYNALQAQLNRRFSRNLQFGLNYTWSKTITFDHQRWVPDELTKNVTGRPHAVNMNFGYTLPSVSRFLGKNRFTKAAFDGWQLSGNGIFYSGTPMTIGCTANGATPGYWTGTPTGGIPFRCQQVGKLYLPKGAQAPTNTDQRLWYPFDKSSFVLPSATSLGIGNTPPTLLYGPGVMSMDLAVTREFRLGKSESRVLQIRFETFNTFNHFNPSNPNTTLNLNFNNGVNTNANFGTVNSAQVQARHAALSVRIRF